MPPLVFPSRRLDETVILPPPGNVLVVHDGHDARLGQIEKPPGDDLVARCAIALLQLEKVKFQFAGIGGKPAGRSNTSTSTKGDLFFDSLW